MKMELKSLMKDKNVLRVMVFLAATNVLGYLLIRDFDAIALFAIVGFLASYFSKNMILILLVAMISTNFYAATRYAPRIREGMKSGSGPEAATSEEDEEEATGSKTGLAQDAGSVKPAGKLDKKATAAKAGDHQVNSTNDPGLMSADMVTARSNAKKNQDLLEHLDTLQPAMEKSMKFIESVPMEKIDQLVDKLGSILGKVGGFSGEAK
jgi:hypothetical protein